jgi:dTDP-glucose pyrophosphorylase
MYADDIHGGDGIKKCLEHEHALLAAENENPEKFGVIMADSSGKIIKIVEKPKVPFSNLVSTGVILTDASVFDYESKLKKGEYYLSEVISKVAQDKDVYAVKSSLWLPIGTPDDLKKAEKGLP